MMSVNIATTGGMLAKGVDMDKEILACEEDPRISKTEVTKKLTASDHQRSVI